MDFGDLSKHGLPDPEDGVFTDLARRGTVPAIIAKEGGDLVKEGRVQVAAAVESLEESGVLLANGERLEPDAVICATGYRCGLEPLVGKLGVLRENGEPKAFAPKAALPGLRFIGFEQRPAGIYYYGREARRSAKAIRRELRTAGAGRPQPALSRASA